MKVSETVLSAVDDSVSESILVTLRERVVDGECDDVTDKVIVVLLLFICDRLRVVVSDNVFVSLEESLLVRVGEPVFVTLSTLVMDLLCCCVGPDRVTDPEASRESERDSEGVATWVVVITRVETDMEDMSETESDVDRERDAVIDTVRSRVMLRVTLSCGVAEETRVPETVADRTTDGETVPTTV